MEKYNDDIILDEPEMNYDEHYDFSDIDDSHIEEPLFNEPSYEEVDESEEIHEHNEYDPFLDDKIEQNDEDEVVFNEDNGPEPVVKDMDNYYDNVFTNDKRNKEKNNDVQNYGTWKLFNYSFIQRVKDKLSNLVFGDKLGIGFSLAKDDFIRWKEADKLKNSLNEEKRTEREKKIIDKKVTGAPIFVISDEQGKVVSAIVRKSEKSEKKLTELEAKYGHALRLFNDNMYKDYVSNYYMPGITKMAIEKDGENFRIVCENVKGDTSRSDITFASRNEAKDFIKNCTPAKMVSYKTIYPNAEPYKREGIMTFDGLLNYRIKNNERITDKDIEKAESFLIKEVKEKLINIDKEIQRKVKGLSDLKHKLEKNTEIAANVPADELNMAKLGIISLKNIPSMTSLFYELHDDLYDLQKERETILSDLNKRVEAVNSIEAEQLSEEVSGVLINGQKREINFHFPSVRSIETNLINTDINKLLEKASNIELDKSVLKYNDKCAEIVSQKEDEQSSFANFVDETRSDNFSISQIKNDEIEI